MMVLQGHGTVTHAEFSIGIIIKSDDNKTVFFRVHQVTGIPPAVGDRVVYAYTEDGIRHDGVGVSKA